MNIIKWLDKNIEGSLLFILSAMMVILAFLQVVMRFIFNNSLTWSEELTRYCFIWLIYIGISLGVKEQKHIRMGALLVFMNDKYKRIIENMANIFFSIFCLVIIYFGTILSLKILAFSQTSPALGVPMGLVYIAAPIGMCLTLIRLIQNIFHFNREKKDLVDET